MVAGDGCPSGVVEAVVSKMVLFVLVALLIATVLLAARLIARVMNEGCRYRCTCVDDAAALSALASIVRNPKSGHDW